MYINECPKGLELSVSPKDIASSKYMDTYIYIFACRSHVYHCCVVVRSKVECTITSMTYGSTDNMFQENPNAHTPLPCILLT